MSGGALDDGSVAAPVDCPPVPTAINALQPFGFSPAAPPRAFAIFEAPPATWRLGMHRCRTCRGLHVGVNDSHCSW
jgi:hypothetical protein